MEKAGIRLAVASDPEGNGYHGIKRNHALHDSKEEQDDVIVLEVFDPLEENNLFK